MGAIFQFGANYPFEEISQRVCQYMTRMDANLELQPLVLRVEWDN